jgi:uncharacterized membrane protein
MVELRPVEPGLVEPASAGPAIAGRTSAELASAESLSAESSSAEVRSAEPRAHGTVGALPENLAGVLAYLTFLPAIVFLIAAPYSKNRFVRFHSLQCLLLWGAGVLFAIALKLASVILLIIPVLGPLLVTLVGAVIVLAGLLIWLVLVIKAFQGEMFRLPVLGDLAAQYSGSL